MPTNAYTPILRIDCAIHPVPSLDILLQDVATALQEEQVSIDVAYTRPLTHRTWQRILYRVLGVRLPEDELCLSICSDRELIFATFEQADSEWVVATGLPRSGVKASLRTHHGEHWQVDTNECIPKTMAEQLIREFFTMKRKPTSVNWRRS